MSHIPSELKYATSHEWIRVEPNGEAVVGITEHAQELLGDMVFVELPGMDDESRYHLCRALERNLSLPGPALVLWAGESPTLQQIERSAFEPIYSR